MNLDDPMSITIPEFYYDLTPNYGNQLRFNCSPTLTATIDQQSVKYIGETTNQSNGYCVSDQTMVPFWSNDFNYDLTGLQSDLFSPQYDLISPLSSTNSHDQSPFSPTTIISNHKDSLDVLSDLPPQTNKSLSRMETESTCSMAISSSSPTNPPTAFKDKQLSQQGVELLQLFESSVFNSLLEDNFIKISLQDEALAVESGLRQLELNKYHELARVVDTLYKDHNPTIKNQNASQEQFQITIVHKHTEKLINAVKRITSFTSLCIDDQISLLKSRFIDLCMIKSLVNIEPKTRTLEVNGKTISMEKCHMMNNDAFIKLTISINPVLRSDPIINLLILLICLLNPNITSLQSTFAVRKEYILTIHLVQKYLEIRGFTINQANYEIKNLICNLEDFLLLFNAKQKIQEIARRHLGYTSQLIAEMLDINGQHGQHHHHYQHQHQHQQPP